MTTPRDQLLETLNAAMNEALANVHTATVAKVTAVGASTISVKPSISRVVNGVKIDLPEFIDVPVVFMRGGGSYMSFPITVGDDALLIFTERCFDNWYKGVNNAVPVDYRMHDYSDGFAIVGIAPASGAIPIPEKTTIQGDLIVNGTITVVGGDVIADTISLKTHTHGGVMAGGANTGVPNA